jgi:hypothetical protein
MEVSFMSRLIVTGLSEDKEAAPGNRYSNYIIVSVTDIDGVPVTGLGESNFKVEPRIVAPFGANVNIENVIETGLSGFYNINIVPIKNETWKKGVYIFAVAVGRKARIGQDRGQTLVSVFMD